MPLEIVIRIFDLFDVHTLLTCSSVCHQWFDLGINPYFANKLRYVSVLLGVTTKAPF